MSQVALAAANSLTYATQDVEAFWICRLYRVCRLRGSWDRL